MPTARSRPIARTAVLALSLLLIALAALIASAPAEARISKATTSYYQNLGSAPILGVKVSGYEGKSVYVAVTSSKGAGATLSVSTTTGLSLPFGYSAYSGSAIAFTGAQDAVNAALATLKIDVTVADTNPIDVSVTAFETKAEVAYNPANQHFYRFVPGKVTGSDAFTAAAATTEFGLTGYLASITTAEENAFVAEKIQGGDGTVARNVWIGAQDADTEGDWEWVGGPDTGLQFWKGCNPANGGAAFEGRFSAWAPGEPNNWNSTLCENENSPTLGEDCAIINKFSPTSAPPDNAFFQGLWNDLPCSYGSSSNHIIAGYIVEFGNKAVGGDFTGLETVSMSLKQRPKAPPKLQPNFFDRVFSLFKKTTKRKTVPKKPNQPASFTFTTSMTFKNPGTYIVTVKPKPKNANLPSNGNPYLLLRGSKAAVRGGKTTTLSSSRWSMLVTTTRANQRVAISPVLKTANYRKPAGTVVSVQLQTDSSQRCPLGWCQNTPIPSPRDEGKR